MSAHRRPARGVRDGARLRADGSRLGRCALPRHGAGPLRWGVRHMSASRSRRCGGRPMPSGRATTVCRRWTRSGRGKNGGGPGPAVRAPFATRLLDRRRTVAEPARRIAAKSPEFLERETGFEPATPTLARLCSTPELLPHRPADGAPHLGRGGRGRKPRGRPAGVSMTWPWRDLPRAGSRSVGGSPRGFSPASMDVAGARRCARGGDGSATAGAASSSAPALDGSAPSLYMAAAGRIAQLVEQLTLNQRVGGSSPPAPTSFKDLAGSFQTVQTAVQTLNACAYRFRSEPAWRGRSRPGGGCVAGKPPGCAGSSRSGGR